jgi:hypothetical protein
MSSCRKNTAITLVGGGSLLIKNFKFSSDRTEVIVFNTGDLTNHCNSDINSSDYLGVKIENNELVFTDAISGLTTNITSGVGNNPTIAISQNGGTLSVIGVDDIGMGFSVPQLNVRYDSATNSVKFQL